MTELKSAEEIRARLNEIAPWKPGEMNAVELARWFAMEAQVIWSRMLDGKGGIDPRDIAGLHGFFAAAHCLLTFHRLAAEAADNTAKVISECLDDPGNLGEHLWEHHGPSAKEVARLANYLAALTLMDENGHVVTLENASQ